MISLSYDYSKWAISVAVETYGSETYIFAVNHYYY